MAVVFVIAAALVVGLFVTSSSRFRRQQKRFGPLGVDISSNPSARAEDVVPATERGQRAVNARVPMLVIGVCCAIGAVVTLAVGVTVLGGLLVVVAVATLASSGQGFAISRRTHSRS